MPQKIIIIGATSGMGRRLAELYAQQGCMVGATGRRKELLDSLQQQYPEQIHTDCFDVTDSSVRDRLQSLVEQMQGIDVVIISAGGGDVRDDLDWQTDQWIVKTNVNGFVAIANWAYNYFMQQGHGQLVTISSVGAYRGNFRAPAYSAAKAFQSIYFEGLAVKAYRSGKPVSITCIEPGFVATKPIKSDKLFWVVPRDKAARQIIQAIERKKRKAYISRRWGLIAFILRWLPYGIYKRIM
ncbi:MAG: SDR family NAD(P)-dependent oxidoreductase [Flavisolibacter sp.]|nr:SDR family NAD(P)-dependent oxidoreductase [Flavisolibacter sp.]